MPYKDKDKQKEYQTKWVAKRRAEFFADKSCIKCGSKVDLELDHINPEEKETHRIWSWSKERREKEIAKCQVLCKTCHLDKTIIDIYGHELHACGTTRKYNYGKCRCALCRRANRDRARVIRARRK